MGINRLRRQYRYWLPLVLAVTAVANFTVHVFLPGSAQPIRPHSQGSLTHLVHTEQRTVDLRYGFYEELADISTGETLVVPERSALDADLLEGLSGVTVVVGDYDPSTMSDVDLVGDAEPLGLLRVDGEDVAYWILPGSGDHRWWETHTNDGIVILPESVAPIPGTGS